MKVTIDGKQYKVIKLAGRGSVGDLNWGANYDRTKEVLEQELESLKQHFGEKVLLTGGGGGGLRLATLVSAEIIRWDEERYALRAHLTGDSLPNGRPDFNPYIDSWQISALELVA